MAEISFRLYFGMVAALAIACSSDGDSDRAGSTGGGAGNTQEAGAMGGSPSPGDASPPSTGGSPTPNAGGTGGSTTPNTGATPGTDGGGQPDAVACVPEGQPIGAAECCTGTADLVGNCCTGTSCCRSQNHSHKGASGECECNVGYISNTPAPNLSCRLDPKLGPHIVDCEFSVTLGYVNSYCECTSNDTNVGSTQINGTCKKDFDSTIAADEVCCSQSGYPQTGGCVCAFRAGPYKCVSANSQSCDCSYLRGVGVPAESACNVNSHTRDNQPVTHTGTWLCCADPSGGSCECTNYKTYCGLGRDGKLKQVVSDCKDAAALGYTTPPAGCKAGDSEVTTCNGTSTCTSDSQCGGSCTGSDPFCCPTCSGGKCMTCCTGSSGTACF